MYGLKQLLLKYQIESDTNKYMTQNHFWCNQKTSPVNKAAKNFIRRPLGEYFEKDFDGAFHLTSNVFFFILVLLHLKFYAVVIILIIIIIILYLCLQLGLLLLSLQVNKYLFNCINYYFYMTMTKW